MLVLHLTFFRRKIIVSLLWLLCTIIPERTLYNFLCLCSSSRVEWAEAAKAVWVAVAKEEAWAAETKAAWAAAETKAAIW